jgi:5-hydroxyisourate hydrolase/2-oxo-4-hydroxy-4-carboxy-5-ureidoimidazoline decarboxylase
MTLYQFNELENNEALAALLRCCGAANWTQSVLQERPYTSEKELVQKATAVWYNECTRQDWLNAFTHHSKIGDLKSIQKKFSETASLASEEQAAVTTTSLTILNDLATANKEYEDKFGFIFIVCATGKGADEMLRLIQNRLLNTYDEELLIAMGEQHKITIIRLRKLLNDASWNALEISQLTTHVLDTSIGKPGKNITIHLQQSVQNEWCTFAQGITNNDGRITDLLPPERILSPGDYKLRFDTKTYFENSNITSFYPSVEIQFTVFDDSHYHVPLLLNPFGYSTYRGS